MQVSMLWAMLFSDAELLNAVERAALKALPKSGDACIAEVNEANKIHLSLQGSQEALWPSGPSKAQKDAPAAVHSTRCGLYSKISIMTRMHNRVMHIINVREKQLSRFIFISMGMAFSLWNKVHVNSPRSAAVFVQG